MLVSIYLISIIALLVISNIVGNLGKDRKIGYTTSFLVTLFYTPLIGLLLVIASTPLTKEELEEKEKSKKIRYTKK